MADKSDKDKPERPRAGTRVKRGKDWRWEEQDGGVGHQGSVISGDVPSDWVAVQWDCGHRASYRWGFLGKYDLVAVPAPFDGPSNSKLPKRGATGTAAAAPASAPSASASTTAPEAPKASEPSEPSASAPCAPDDRPPALLWDSICALRDSMPPEFLRDKVPTEPPETLAKVYKCITKLESAIKSDAQSLAWFVEGGRDKWGTDLAGPRCSVAHAARCLVRLEESILSSCQRAEWRERRIAWRERLISAASARKDDDAADDKRAERLAALLFISKLAREIRDDK